ncbi:MAG: hypothetical protein HYU66_08360, partial [Armatimonadetes bacterium]|nr:hypothetical protein [Armatimonadota bacterium]
MFELLIPLLPLLSLAAPSLPLEFDTDPGWIARPGFLPNPAQRPQVTAADGVLTLAVDEPGRGMKLELPLRGLDAERVEYLVLRYRARHLAGGYALWAFDQRAGGGELINTGQLVQDGEWHTLALNLQAAGAQGAVRALVTELECAGEPAELSFDWWRAADEPPGGADVHPPLRPEEPPLELRFAELPPPKPEPDWLALDAATFGAAAEAGLLHLHAEGADRGMKFSVPLAPPVDLRPYGFIALRYRASGLAPWGDYSVWLGSGPGGKPDQYASPLPLGQLECDGAWHVAVAPLAAPFAVREIALQVSSQAVRGDLWLDRVSFSTTRPLLDAGDVLPLQTGWGQSRLKRFRAVDLSARADGRSALRLRGMGLRTWLPAGKLTVHGIPFDLLAPGTDWVVTPDDIDRRASVPVGAQGSELYLLMAARLPARDAGRMGDPVPMTRFDTPERFRVAVVYADGVTDEIFPVSVAGGTHQVRSGAAVYALPGLRRAELRRVELINRMESAWLALAGVTLNQGEPVTAEPPVPGLPPTPPAWRAAAAKPAVRVDQGQVVVDDGLLELTLATRAGLRVTGLKLRGGALSLAPGPLFTLGVGDVAVTSERVTLQPPVRSGATVRIPFASPDPAVPLAGELRLGAAPDGLSVRLGLRNAGAGTIVPKVRFPILRGVTLGTAAETWYLWACKGGIVSNLATHQSQAYGGEYPLQVADLFNPRRGYGVALLTADRDDLYRQHELDKDEHGAGWQIDYWPAEVAPGGSIETAPTILRGHAGDWRRALGLYRQWAKSWYRPQVPRKPWFERTFYYQQTTAWGALHDAAAGRWRMKETIEQFRGYFGRLDYLHIFDFGDSHVYGRVGDYNHYDELGGLPGMRAAIAEAQAMGVPIGLYIEGYLCDERGVWGREHVAQNDIRKQDGTPLLWDGAPTEHMMCPAAEGWRRHQAETYRRVAGELQPSGMYIDQYGFINTWKTCWSREHGHPVPVSPLRGERDTTRAIRAAVPAGIATLTEETPNDVNSQYQDGALGYSVTWANPTLAPHRVDLFRFCYPSFKVFQLVSYNPFTEGGWQLL